MTGKEFSPSFFWPFWAQVILTGTSWGIFWGIFMFLSVWRDKNFLHIFLPSLIGGILFGLCMATVQKYNKRKTGLSTWDRFGEDSLDPDSPA
jgi:hypothetical protein